MKVSLMAYTWHTAVAPSLCLFQQRKRKGHGCYEIITLGVLLLWLASPAESIPYSVSVNALRGCQGRCCPQRAAGDSSAGVPLWVPPRSQGKPNVRRSSFTAFQDKSYVDKYKLAYKLLKKQSAVWSGQVGTHCAYCAADVLGGDVHNSDLFFPWHRWYLYWHERILQSLLKDPTFTLPFWEWDSPRNGSKTLPWVYSERRSSLGNKRRNKDMRNLQAWIENSASPAQMQAQVLYSTISQQFFGGRFGSGEGGNFEGSSHAAVHNAVGEQQFPYRDMADLAWASNDPVFYAHHANVDRMWTIWKRLGPDANGNPRSEPAYQDFLNSTFLFVDEKGSLRRCSVRNALNTLDLGYTYEDTSIDWLPTTRGRHLVSKEAHVDPSEGDKEECTTAEVAETLPPSWKLGAWRAPMSVEGISFSAKPTTIHLALVTAAHRLGHSPTLYKRTGAVCKQGSMNAEILSIKGVRWFCRRPFMINIFVDNPQASLNTPKTVSSGFLITWQYVPSAVFTRSGVKEISWGVPLHPFLKLTQKLEKQELSFTFVPFTIGASGTPVLLTDVPEGVAFAKSLFIKYQ